MIDDTFHQSLGIYEQCSAGVYDGGEAGYVHDVGMAQAGIQEAGSIYGIGQGVGGGYVVQAPGFEVESLFS